MYVYDIEVCLVIMIYNEDLRSNHSVLFTKAYLVG